MSDIVPIATSPLNTIRGVAPHFRKNFLPKVEREKQKIIVWFRGGYPDNSAEVKAERGRTLDQIKRLYAVAMGFAATECVKNIVISIRHSNDEFAARFIFISFGVAFISLMILFFLGAERYLDRRYLQSDSAAVTRHGLGWDIICLIVTVTWFVVLAQSFPTIPQMYPDEKIAAGRELIEGGVFIRNIIILYIIDAIMIFIQLCRTFLTLESSVNRYNIAYAHLIWMVINIISAVIVGYAIYNNPYNINLYQLSTLFVLIHVMRLFIDFGLTFKFYYPVGSQGVVPN